jgi:hypothetical protein
MAAAKSVVGAAGSSCEQPHKKAMVERRIESFAIRFM